MKVSFLLMLFALLVGCSDNSSSSNKEPHQPDIEEDSIPDAGADPQPGDVVRPGDSDGDSVTSGQKLPDDPPNYSAISRYQAVTDLLCDDCDESVGFIVGIKKSYDTSSAYVCTGTLIGKNTVLTNAHCIPKDIRKGWTTKCTDRISIRFPKTDKVREETFYCADLIYSTSLSPEPTSKDEDYAIFTINRYTKRKFLPISREGISADTSYKMTVVDPVSNSRRVQGRMRKQENCVVKTNTFVVPDFLSRDSQTATLFHCPIISGNSGSSLRTSGDKIVGVMFGTITLNPMPNSSMRDDLAVGTNFACTNHEGALGTRPDRCKDSKAADIAERVRLDDSQTEKVTSVDELQIQDYISNMSSKIKLKKKVAKLFIKNEYSWASTWKLEPDCLTSPFESESERVIYELHWNYKFEFDSYWRLDFTKYTVEEEKWRSFSVNYKVEKRGSSFWIRNQSKWEAEWQEIKLCESPIP